MKNSSTKQPRIKLAKAATKVILFNSKIFLKASHRQNKPQIERITVAYKGTMLSNRPIWSKNGSNNAVKPKRANAKFVFSCPISK